MSTSERLQVMEALWDSFRYENEKIETPEWHKNIPPCHFDERSEEKSFGAKNKISLSE